MTGFDPAVKARDAEHLAVRVHELMQSCREQATPQQREAIEPQPLDGLRRAATELEEFAALLRDPESWEDEEAG